MFIPIQNRGYLIKLYIQYSLLLINALNSGTTNNIVITQQSEHKALQDNFLANLKPLV